MKMTARRAFKIQIFVAEGRGGLAQVGELAVDLLDRESRTVPARLRIWRTRTSFQVLAGRGFGAGKAGASTLSRRASGLPWGKAYADRARQIERQVKRPRLGRRSSSWQPSFHLAEEGPREYRFPLKTEGARTPDGSQNQSEPTLEPCFRTARRSTNTSTQLGGLAE